MPRADIFFDAVQKSETPQVRKPTREAPFWKRDPVGIRTQDPQLRSFLDLWGKNLINK